jgi:AraC-like DNA-binding protein
VQIAVENIALDSTQSFAAFKRGFAPHDHAYHIHEEVELAVVTGTQGIVHCAANTTAFSSGDLFLFGPNVPHQFIGHGPENSVASAYALQFRSDLFGEGFLSLPENRPLRKLLERARVGLVLRGAGDETIAGLSGIVRSKGTLRLAKLLGFLGELSQRPEWTPIAGLAVATDSNSRDIARLRLLQDQLQRRSHEELREADISSELGLSRTSFCRWIRSVTGRTFTDILNDHRIAQATLLLRRTDRPVGTIALDCGYQSIPHFYREFSKRHSLRPTELRGGVAGRRRAAR